jgi:hypothetical protein
VNWNDFLFAPMPRGHRAFGAATAAGLTAAALLWISGRGVGVTWDEAIYIRFSEGLRAWWAAGHPWDAGSLQQVWNSDVYHNPHPPLMKILSAMTGGLLHGVVPFPLEYRLAHALFVGLAAAAAFAVLALYGSPALAGLGVALSLSQPRVWADLMLATSDGAVAACWLTVTLLGAAAAEERSPGPRRWLWGALVFFLAAGSAAKVTAILSVAPLAFFFAATRRWRDLGFLAAATAVALVFVWLVSAGDWDEPAEGLYRYLALPFLKKQAPIAAAYAGRVHLSDMPWHAFDVMSLTVLPEPVLVGLGLLVLGRFPGGAIPKATASAAAFWILLMHVPGVPRHDGVRQFVAFFPLLGVLAAAGVLGALRHGRVDPRVGAGVAGALALSLAGVLAAAHPFESSYYNTLSGGLPAAERRGMEITYYFDVLDRDVLAQLNAALRPGDKVALIPQWPDLLGLYQENGLLRSDVEVTVLAQKPDVVVVCRRRSMVDEGWYRALPAVAERSWRGVSLVKVSRVRHG